jgi:hypothetical protein
MALYTVKRLGEHSFEVAKWTDRKEPVCYEITETKRSWHCDFCYTKFNCKHAEIVQKFRKAKKLDTPVSDYYDLDTGKFKKSEFSLD